MPSRLPVPDPVELALRLRDAPLEPTLRVLGELAAAQRRRRGEAPPPAATGRPGYDRARRRYHAHEQRLREQLSLADEIVQQLLPGLGPADAEPAPLQQELRLEAEPGRRAVGRFVLSNELDREVELRFEIGSLRCPDGELVPAPARIEPAAPRLAAGAECVARIELDLGRAELAPGETAELVLEVRTGDRLLTLVWVSVRVGRAPHPEVDP